MIVQTAFVLIIPNARAVLEASMHNFNTNKPQSGIGKIPPKPQPDFPAHILR
jgi:hypothetical protein